MNSQGLHEITLERAIVSQFALETDISQIIVWRVDAGRSVQATVFLTRKKQLYAYIEAQMKLSLGDVMKIVSRMGLRAERYLPPRGIEDYFDVVASKKFSEVFPGRKCINNDDLKFYRTLVPYQPALVLVSEVIHGEIYQYDSDARTGWRVSAKFMYRRIKTS